MTLYFLTISFILGLIIGSFINCLVYRLHKKKSMWSRSFCPKCKHRISWYDNVPVFSFLFLKGKCRHCGKGISWQYPIVEFVTGVLFVAAFFDQFLIFNLPAQGWSALGGEFLNNLEFYNFIIFKQLDILFLLRNWFVISVMVVIFLYDLKYYMILDVVTLPAVIVMIVINSVLGMTWQNLAVSGIIGLGFFLVQFVVSKGKWIGGGDLRLGLLMGVTLGWPYVLVAIMLSYISGSFVGVYLIITSRKEWGSKVPLGVFLSVGTVVALLYGEGILRWYMGLF